ncbi:uncharacterized protein CEXT_390101, partial [Caerostris extrusa]
LLRLKLSTFMLPLPPAYHPLEIAGNASDRVFVVDVDNYHQYSTNSLDRQAFSNSGFGLLESPLRSFSISQDSQLLGSKSMTHSPSNEMKNINNKKHHHVIFDRLTVRAMPDPVGFEEIVLVTILSILNNHILLVLEIACIT